MDIAGVSGGRAVPTRGPSVGAVGHLVGAVAGVARTCECKDALATALITQRDLIPERLKRELASLVGKYLPAKPVHKRRK